MKTLAPADDRRISPSLRLRSLLRELEVRFVNEDDVALSYAHIYAVQRIEEYERLSNTLAPERMRQKEFAIATLLDRLISSRPVPHMVASDSRH